MAFDFDDLPDDAKRAFFAKVKPGKGKSRPHHHEGESRLDSEEPTLQELLEAVEEVLCERHWADRFMPEHLRPERLPLTADKMWGFKDGNSSPQQAANVDFLRTLSFFQAGAMAPPPGSGRLDVPEDLPAENLDHILEISDPRFQEWYFKNWKPHSAIVVTPWGRIQGSDGHGLINENEIKFAIPAREQRMEDWEDARLQQFYRRPLQEWIKMETTLLVKFPSGRSDHLTVQWWQNRQTGDRALFRTPPVEAQ